MNERIKEWLLDDDPITNSYLYMSLPKPIYKGLFYVASFQNFSLIYFYASL